MKAYLFSLVLLFSTQLSVFAGISDEIVNIIRSGNAKELSRYFDSNVDLKVLEQEDIYSKAQAELIIKNFFAKHPVKTYDVAHKSAPKKDSEYSIGTLETTNGKFRVYILIKGSADNAKIHQFRIEPENE